LYNNNFNIGKFIISIGLLIVFIGAIFIFREKIPLLKKLGHLPGDVVIEKENFKFYFPITTSILISIVISLILWIIRASKLH
jgi:hypothetical protein